MVAVLLVVTVLVLSDCLRRSVRSPAGFARVLPMFRERQWACLVVEVCVCVSFDGAVVVLGEPPFSYACTLRVHTFVAVPGFLDLSHFILEGRARQKLRCCVLHGLFVSFCGLYKQHVVAC